MVKRTLFEVSDLSCERDDRTLFQDINFTACAGEIWQVAGPNGAGKTTLLRILAGLFGHFQGVVSRLQSNPDWRRQLLFMGHQHGLREELTAEENLCWLCHMQGRNVANLPQALKAIGLSGFQDVLVAHMSAGQKRRVSLARLWLDAPTIWILDEPFTAIDVDGVALVEQQLRQHAGQGGLVIYTSHHRLAADTRQLQLGTSARSTHS